MEKQILQQLNAIEQKYGVNILLACETGSRAWGFPSPDSDYDVRFIYMHPLDWYLSIEDKKDTIEYMAGELDLVGWDIRKSLHLFRKSNAALLERIQSPMVYKQQGDFREQLSRLAPDYFSRRAGLHHYLSMAFKYYKACALEEEVKLKSYFYMLRTTLASLWIVEKRSIPPLAFGDLVTMVREQDLLDRMLSLVALKAKVAESYRHPKDTALEAYVKEILHYCESRADEFNKYQGDIEPLNEFFRKTPVPYVTHDRRLKKEGFTALRSH